MKYFKSIILSLIILILITYPASPVFFLAYFSNTYEFYFFYLFIIVIFTLNELRFNLKRSQFSDSLFKFSILLLLAVPIISFVITKNSTALRDFSTLLVFVIILFFTQKTFKKILIHNIIYCFTLFVLLSIVIIVVYSPFHYQNDIWRVTKDLISVKNPIFLRNDQGDFNYYFPYFLSVVPIDDKLGINTRLPLLFTESTYFYYFSLPFFGLTIIDKEIKYRKFILFILLVGFLLSRSILGIFGILIAIIYTMLNYGREKKRWFLKMSITIAVAIVVYYSYVFLDDLFNTKKSEELEIYTSPGAIELVLSSVSMFGLNFEPEDFKVYGSVILLIRYGIFGVMSILFFIISLIRILSKIKYTVNEKVILFGISLILLACPLFSLKVPNLINYALLIVVARLLDIKNMSVEWT